MRRNSFVKNLAMLLSASLVLTAMPVDAAKKSVVKLSSKKISVVKGKTKKVTVKTSGKFKFKKAKVKKVTKKKIAKITVKKNKLSVKGLKKGTVKATIAVTYTNKGKKATKNLSLKITVKNATTVQPQETAVASTTPEVSATPVSSMTPVTTASAQESKAPVADASATPAVGTETVAPVVSETPVESTVAPEVTESQAPEVVETQAPEVVETQAPEVSETQAPEIGESTSPALENFVEPEEKDYEAIEEIPEDAVDEDDKIVVSEAMDAVVIANSISNEYSQDIIGDVEYETSSIESAEDTFEVYGPTEKLEITVAELSEENPTKQASTINIKANGSYVMVGNMVNAKISVAPNLDDVKIYFKATEIDTEISYSPESATDGLIVVGDNSNVSFYMDGYVTFYEKDTAAVSKKDGSDEAVVQAGKNSVINWIGTIDEEECRLIICPVRFTGIKSKGIVNFYNLSCHIWGDELNSERATGNGLQAKNGVGIDCASVNIIGFEGDAIKTTGGYVDCTFGSISGVNVGGNGITALTSVRAIYSDMWFDEVKKGIFVGNDKKSVKSEEDVVTSTIYVYDTDIYVNSTKNAIQAGEDEVPAEYGVNKGVIKIGSGYLSLFSAEKSILRATDGIYAHPEDEDSEVIIYSLIDGVSIADDEEAFVDQVLAKIKAGIFDDETGAVIYEGHIDLEDDIIDEFEDDLEDEEEEEEEE